jgi:hypothetical protein
MRTDPPAITARGRRWALWLLMVAGVMLHSGLCPPDTRAGVVGAATLTCAPPAAATADGVGGDTTGSARAGDADGPCAPAPHSNHHAPCCVMTHRAAAQQRSAAPWQDRTVPPAPLQVPYAGATGGAPSCGRPSRAPARRSGADLLVALCSFRT